MGQLMSECGQVSLASIRQEHTVAQGNRSTTAGLEDDPPEPSGSATAFRTVQAHARPVSLERYRLHHPPFGL
jgi:hypothetical protein